MNRLILIALVLTFSYSTFAQSSLTLSYDGIGVYSGARLKYAYSTEHTQVGGYASSMFYFIDGVEGPVIISGVSINSVPNRNKNVGVYAGGSVEYITAPPYGWEGRAYLIGPQMGLIIRLSEHVSINPEWGVRAGVVNAIDYNRSFSGAGKVSRLTQFLVYLPASIGLRYTFHKKR